MRYLGLDWGMKQIGLAVSEGNLATPSGELTVNGLQDGIEKVIKLVDKDGIDQIVIGLPENKMGQIVLNVTRILQKKGLNVVNFDETLSSQNAKLEMIRIGVSKKARRSEHSYAASIILQEYLDDQI